MARLLKSGLLRVGALLAFVAIAVVSFSGIARGLIDEPRPARKGRTSSPAS
jgi:hypothetical protein